ncbi:MAG: bifunctional folylpolyglutamate synthase/dihydrofolate synthase [Bryobacteraceae bacterium]
MNYPDSVRYLYALGNEIKSAKLGLDRVTTLLDRLGKPQEACRFVHVAGTNGKGSTSAMIESGLRAAGVRTGLYTSPHLLEPTERIRVAGCPVSRQQFSTAFDDVHAASEALIRDGSLDAHPSYFETMTAMAFVLFRELRVDTAVLEVGLGGRLDATNVVRPRLSVITRIDFDHMEYLGDTIGKIAAEKAGILKSGVPAVFSVQHPEAMDVLDLTARRVGIDPIRTGEWPLSGLSLDAGGSRFAANGFPIVCPLAGEHQVENAVTAAAALVQLGVAPEALQQGIAATRWPGRLDRISASPEILADGAHNVSGARALAAHLRRFYRDRAITIIYGSMRDKRVDEIGDILFPLARTVIATAPEMERSLPPERIRAVTSHPDLRVASSLDEAVSLAGTWDVLVITGSLYLVAEALRRWGNTAPC